MHNTEDLQGTILRIEKISLNDGEGMRTVVFFKGCPCRCIWCSTPESQNPAMEVYYQKSKCRLCGACIVECPADSLAFSADGTTVVRDLSKCTNCFKCVDICKYRAQNIYGKEMTVSQIMKEILKDEVFYFFSGGGVTLSGGDVFVQTPFAEAVLTKCEELFINTCAELDMYTGRENIARIIPRLDMIYMDIKTMDPDMHKKWCSVDNKIILDNIRYASTICKKDAIHIRVPLIEGFNDNSDNIYKTAGFCASMDNIAELEFLPYHRLGIHAYEQLQREYDLRDLAPMTRFDVYNKTQFLCDMNLPFKISISNLEVYNPEAGRLPVSEDALKL